LLTDDFLTASFARSLELAFGERAVLKLMFGALIRGADRWRSIKVTEFEHRQITAVRKELDQESRPKSVSKHSLQRRPR
jgi:hypothetical protein